MPKGKAAALPVESCLHSGHHSFQELWRVIRAAWVCLNCRVNKENQLSPPPLSILSFSS